MAAKIPAPIKHGSGPASFYNNPLFSDVEIKFSGNTFLGHRSILSLKSRYFYTAFSSGFKEAHTKVIDLGEHDDPKCIYDMLRHIYGCKIRLLNITYRRENEEPSPVAKLLDKIDLFVTADKYQVQTLCNLVEKRVNYDLHRISTDEYDTPEFITALTNMFDHVGDRQLRDTAVCFCSSKLARLTEAPAFNEMLKGNGSASFELLTMVMEETREGQDVWACLECEHVQEGPGECPQDEDDCYCGPVVRRKLVRPRT